MQNAPANLST